VVSPGEQAGGNDRGVIAYNRKTGEKVWGAGNVKGAYASPMLATLGGVRQIVMFEGSRLAGYDPTGAGELWTVPWPAPNDINVAQPLLLGNNRVFVTSGYAGRCGMVRVATSDPESKGNAAVGLGGGAGVAERVTRPGGKPRPEEEWHNAALRCRFCSPILHDGLIYGLDEGILECLDPKDGRRVWRGGRYGQGQFLRCDDLLVILSEAGELALVHAAANKSRELGRLKVLEGDKTWNCPTLAGGKAYIRNHVEIACYDLRE